MGWEEHVARMEQMRNV